jgi:hypothetical protein
MYLKATLQAEARKLRRWIEASLLALYPFADDIVDYVKRHLDELQPYLPDNIYKAFGGAIVAASLAFGFLAAHRAVKKAAQAAEKESSDAGQPAP